MNSIQKSRLKVDWDLILCFKLLVLSKDHILSTYLAHLWKHFKIDRTEAVFKKRKKLYASKTSPVDNMEKATKVIHPKAFWLYSLLWSSSFMKVQVVKTISGNCHKLSFFLKKKNHVHTLTKISFIIFNYKS